MTSQAPPPPSSPFPQPTTPELAPPSVPPSGLPFAPMPPEAPRGWHHRHDHEDPGSHNLAVAALVCALLPIPLTVIAGIIMASIVLGRGRARAGSGRGLAIGALVAGACWILLGVGLIAFAAAHDVARTDGAVTKSGRVLATALRTGDCFTVPDGKLITTVTVLPCTQPHDAEVYAEFELDPGAYPGDRLVTGAAQGGCGDRWKAAIGSTLEESALELYYFRPTQRTWSDRTVICAATELDVKSSGSLLHSGR